MKYTFEASQTTNAHQYIVLNLREGVDWEGVASCKASVNIATLGF